MYKVIIFDMDGTIIDTDYVIFKSWEEMIKTFKPKGFKVDKKQIATFSGPPIGYAINTLFPDSNYDEVLKEYRSRTGKYYDQYCHIFTHCAKVCRTLKKDGYKLAIVTNKNIGRTKDCLKRAHIFNLFDFIVTCESVDSQKPDPTGMNLVLSHFGVTNKEVLAVGDTDYDYLAAKNANIDCVLMSMNERFYNLVSNPHPLAFCKNYDELYKEIKKYEN